MADKMVDVMVVYFELTLVALIEYLRVDMRETQ